ESGAGLDAIATHDRAARWGPIKPAQLQQLSNQYPGLGEPTVHVPASYMWPSFLTWANLLNVVKNNADVAIIAIGMTMVIIAAGIDLSVGSLLALSAVVTAVSIQSWAGAESATRLGLVACCLLGVGLCLLVGTFTGLMVTFCRVPAFIVTLAMMMIARGLSLIIAVSYQSSISVGSTTATPEAVKIQSALFGWLGNGELLGIPNPIWIILALYAAAHFVMTRTAFGRYVYAVGGNPEAARLSGVPVFAILVIVYALCAGFAGLAGVLDASRFEGGRPKAGTMYELRVIAAVVVGGTSLLGGEGRILGTLIGALIIAVIQNGLNMAGVASYEQMVVFGMLILGAALLDQAKKHWIG
ncbi:MAG: hypothetical protein KDA60_19325, partial [Planctomycetales bacterium]|nr:hypothetical protein [Planctomycetales bacterium]